MKSKLFYLLLFPYFAFAQKIVDVEKDNTAPAKDGLFYVSDAVFSPYKYVRVVAGTPYFNDTWSKGVVIFSSGRKAKSNYLKLDLLSGEVIYKDTTGRELVATNPISQLILTDSATGKDLIFRNSSVHPFSSKKTNVGWYQELETGTATLYKKINKSTYDTRPFNSATTEQTINTKNLYFIELGNDLTAFKKLKDIPAILSDKKKELDDFILSSKLPGTTDADFIEVIAKYNKLAVSN